MSANGAFSSTLDYAFIGGGVIQVTGPVSVSIDPVFVATAEVPIFAQSTNSLDFILTDAGIETPTIGAYVNVSTSFTASATAEQGVQRFASSEWINRIEFTANSAGIAIVKGELNQTLPFLTNTNIYVFSEGPASGSINFSVSAQAYNMTDRVRSRTGGNEVLFKTNEYNGVRIPQESNGLRLVDNGVREADIIQN